MAAAAARCSFISMRCVTLAGFYWHDMGTGWGILMLLGMVVVWLIRSATTKEKPRQIRDTRLASGELSVEEYECLRSAMNATTR